MVFKNKKNICIIIILIIIVLIIIELVKSKNKDNYKSDTTCPIIVLGDTYTVKKGYNKNLVDEIVSADDIDNNPIREIIGDYDFNTLGEYYLTYKITDNSGNFTTKDFVLKVKDDISYNEEIINLNDAVDEYKVEHSKIGIDVSKWQGEIDWEKISNSQVEFAIIRMSYQKGFDGEVLIDPFFINNIENCRKYNIPVAVYFSSYAKTMDEAKKQAEWVVENLMKYNYSNIAVAFDWENWNSFNSLHLSLNDINIMADTFMKELENYGYKPILYGSKTYLEQIWQNNSNYPVWLANYVKSTTYEKQYKIWQFTQKGIVKGINGYVDINVMYVD